MKRMIGIDFGTSTTLVAVREGLDSAPQILPLGTGADPWVPSLIAQTDPIVVGEKAESVPPELQVRSIKSGLTRGKEWLDSQSLDLNEVQVREYVKAILAEVIKRSASKKRGLFTDAKVYLGCPALWSFGNRRILADIANELGLDVDVLDILDEPVAAGVNWIKSEWRDGSRGLELSGKTLVFDAGGGTLDVALLEVSGTENPEISVLSADSLPRSGDDIDNSIVAHFKNEDPSLVVDSQNRILLFNAARRLKEILSKDLSANAQVAAPISRSFALTRGKLEELAEPQVLESLRLVERVLRQSLLRADSMTSTTSIRSMELAEITNGVKHVVLVGGLSQMPIFTRRLQHMFESATITQVAKPQQSVAEGLTYANTVIHLNMPRPPLSFVMKPLKKGAADVILYEAFGEIVNHWQAMQGNFLLGHTADLSSVIDGVYEISCVLPNRERTEIPLVINRGSSKDEYPSIRVEHNSGSEAGKVFFKLYATGEFLIRGKGTELKLRAKTWGRLRSGSDLGDRRIELDDVTSKFEGDSGNDASQASRK